VIVGNIVITGVGVGCGRASEVRRRGSPDAVHGMRPQAQLHLREVAAGGVGEPTGVSVQPVMMIGAVGLARLGWRSWPWWNSVSHSRVKIADMLRPELGIPRWR